MNKTLTLIAAVTVACTFGSFAQAQGQGQGRGQRIYQPLIGVPLHTTSNEYSYNYDYTYQIGPNGNRFTNDTSWQNRQMTSGGFNGRNGVGGFQNSVTQGGQQSTGMAQRRNHQGDIITNVYNDQTNFRRLDSQGYRHTPLGNETWDRSHMQGNDFRSNATLIQNRTGSTMGTIQFQNDPFQSGFSRGTQFRRN
jgi:hypothetical protein